MEAGERLVLLEKKDETKVFLKNKEKAEDVCQMTSKMQKDSNGKWLLRHPVLPIVRIVRFLFLTGEFQTIDSILDELVEPIEMSNAVYDDPQAFLRPYLPVIKEYEILKKKDAEDSFPLVLGDDLKPLDRFEALELWIDQQLLTMELERINSLLCEPCGCVSCCVGPELKPAEGTGDSTINKHFFEIPLSSAEIGFFDLPMVDNDQTRVQTAMSEPSMTVKDRPFYEAGRSIYNWQNGWSMILPRNTVCPQLNADKRCNIYGKRPEVCRRPQIFPYAIERMPGRCEEVDGIKIPACISRRKLLAVWDCPYVRELKDEIAGYAELCELEPVFMENKGQASNLC